MNLRDRLEEIVALRVVDLRALGGGQIGSVRAVEFENGRKLVAKTSPGTPLTLEAKMLRYLAGKTTLPVPEVVWADDDLLLMEHMPGSMGADGRAEEYAARLLAELHEVSSDAFGFRWDTLIGPFVQPNESSVDWPLFFGERRLRFMAEIAIERGRLPAQDLDRVEALIERLPDLLDHDPAPSLIHGDVWSGNVLSDGGHVTALLDPAIYFADAEVELAFIELFGTFGEGFLSMYRELRGIDPNFGALRRDVYQVYPLLVHVAVFGEGYLARLRARLDRVGA